jgi:hypothetical protein
MADEKQMNAIRFFCRTPYSDHGLKRASGKGRYYHDWSDLIQQISYFDFGHVQKDAKMVQSIALVARKAYPNGEDWEVIVKAPGAHENILSIIRSGLAVNHAVKKECA